MNPPLLRVEGLSISAAGAPGPIVDGLSFQIASGQVLALVGESGSGKTSTALACMGYARPGCRITAGEVRLGGRDILKLSGREQQAIRGREIAYVAQSAAASFNAAQRLNTQVTEIPVVRGILGRGEARRRALDLYRLLDLPDPESIGRRYPHEVSGGQLQRMMLAMAMICDPKLLILDEPTTALDVTTQIEVLQALKRLTRERRVSALCISHDLAVVAQLADDVLVMKEGRFVELGETGSVIAHPKQPYTRRLIGAAHVMPAGPPAEDVPDAAIPGEAGLPPLLEVTGVSVSYDGVAKVLAVDDASLAVQAGSTLGLIGESGSGKTTLGRAIAGLLRPAKGEVRLAGRKLGASLTERTRAELQQIQFIFQMADTALNPKQDIRKILSRPLRLYLGLSGREVDREVDRLLDMMQLPQAFASRRPQELSGGQRQRINLARALAARPKVVICDEITSALDSLVGEAVLTLLESLQRELAFACIFISHDLSTVAKVARTVAVMQRGRLVEVGSTESLLRSPRHAYTRQLLRSVPELRRGWLEEVSARSEGAQARMEDNRDRPSLGAEDKRASVGLAG